MSAQPPFGGRGEDIALVGVDRLAARLQSELGVRVTLRTVLTHPTVASLAWELDRRAEGGGQQAPLPAVARVPRAPYPASPPLE